MYTFVARQPILDAKMKTYAYELLFRKGLTNAFPNVSSEEATTSLLAEQFINQPIENLVGDKIAFVNFPYSLIIEGLASSLPRNKVVIEILEDATPNKELLASIKELKNFNYTIALDDFTLEPEWDPFLPYVDIIKFDWKLTPQDVIQNYIYNHFKEFKRIICLAEKIETYEEFEKAKKMGFKLFQGYFFSKPEIVKNKTISANQFFVSQLFNETLKDPINFEKVELILSQDQALTYRLLRYVNNVRYGSSDVISSIKHAVVFLGRDNLKRFVVLMWSTAMSEAFMGGLLSLLDAMMDKPFDDILGTLPIGERIKSALIDKKGELAFYLGLVVDYENLNWSRLKARVTMLGITEQNVIDIYLEAAQWANTLLSEM